MRGDVMIAVSKCLLGENCRYDGGHCKDEKIMAYLKDKEFVAICPECLGGLPIPREPSEIIDGKVYSMTQHGFSRHNEYVANQISDEEVVFTLTSNEEIAKQYPYLFKLDVAYKLEKNVLVCNCKVTNIDDKIIYFQIGGHPAFACPFMDDESSNDYYLEFSENETLSQKVIDVARKGMSRTTIPFFENERRFFVRQQLFSNDAIVFKDFKSESVSLKSLNHNKSIVFHMQGFNHLGLWAAKHVGGLIAIEPWVGHSDYVDFDGEFKDKEGIVSLEPNHEFECTFKVEINQ